MNKAELSADVAARTSMSKPSAPAAVPAARATAFHTNRLILHY